MDRDEQPILHVQLATEAIIRGGAEKTTVTTSPKRVVRLRALVECDGGRLLPGKTRPTPRTVRP